MLYLPPDLYFSSRIQVKQPFRTHFLKSGVSKRNEEWTFLISGEVIGRLGEHILLLENYYFFIIGDR